MEIFQALYDDMIIEEELKWAAEMEQLKSEVCGVMIGIKPAQAHQRLGVETYYLSAIRPLLNWRAIVWTSQAERLCEELKAKLGPDVEDALWRHAGTPSGEALRELRDDDMDSGPPHGIVGMAPWMDFAKQTSYRRVGSDRSSELDG